MTLGTFAYSFRYLICIGIFIGSELAHPPSITAEEFKAADVQAKIVAAVEKAMPAAVAVHDRGVIFSAVIVNKKGYVLSAGHAVSPNRSYRIVLSDGRRVRAVGLGMNRRIDCAMLKITDQGDWPFVEMGHSSALLPNQPVIGISHPGIFDMNRGPSVRFGRIIKPMTSNEAMILSTVKIEPGDSGGALLDLDGKLVGIHSNIRRSTDENYAVPVDTYTLLWDKLTVAKRFEFDGWPNLPKLGFRANTNGLEVVKVHDGGLADQAGLKVGDVIRQLNNRSVDSASRIRSKMIDLRSKGIDQFVLKVTRGDVNRNLTFRIQSEHPEPIVYPELRGIPKELEKLESRLDDTTCTIHSRKNGESLTVRALRLVGNGIGNLVSKSSEVGDSPIVELVGGSRVQAKVVKRDRKNDLVLLQAELPGRMGIDFSRIHGDLVLPRGNFLVSTDPKGRGDISVWSSNYFHAPRTKASGGFLGVNIGQRPGSAYFSRVLPNGAANRAGIKQDDVLLRLNNVKINRFRDVELFLRDQDPSGTIKALIRRGEDELTKEIVLGQRPEESRHVANNLSEGKSIRRDGFDLVVSHDANVGAEECGGPVFDLNGSFVGINISRFSRTRCYILPRSIIKRFVESGPSS